MSVIVQVLRWCETEFPSHAWLATRTCLFTLIWPWWGSLWCSDCCPSSTYIHSVNNRNSAPMGSSVPDWVSVWLNNLHVLLYSCTSLARSCWWLTTWSTGNKVICYCSGWDCGVSIGAIAVRIKGFIVVIGRMSDQPGFWPGMFSYVWTSCQRVPGTAS